MFRSNQKLWIGGAVLALVVVGIGLLVMSQDDDSANLVTAAEVREGLQRSTATITYFPVALPNGEGVEQVVSGEALDSDGRKVQFAYVFWEDSQSGGGPDDWKPPIPAGKSRWRSENVEFFSDANDPQRGKDRDDVVAHLVLESEIGTKVMHPITGIPETLP